MFSSLEDKPTSEYVKLSNHSSDAMTSVGRHCESSDHNITSGLPDNVCQLAIWSTNNEFVRGPTEFANLMLDSLILNVQVRLGCLLIINLY